MFEFTKEKLKVVFSNIGLQYQMLGMLIRMEWNNYKHKWRQTNGKLMTLQLIPHGDTIFVYNVDYVLPRKCFTANSEKNASHGVPN